MTAHVVDIETEPVGRSCAAHGMVHRWRCACGSVGDWKRAVRSARQGGTRHAAMSDRAR